MLQLARLAKRFRDDESGGAALEYTVCFGLMSAIIGTLGYAENMHVVAYAHSYLTWLSTLLPDFLPDPS